MGRAGHVSARRPIRLAAEAGRPFGHGGEKALARLPAIADDIDADLDLAADARGGGVGDGAPRGARVHRRPGPAMADSSGRRSRSATEVRKPSRDCSPLPTISKSASIWRRTHAAMALATARRAASASTAAPARRWPIRLAAEAARPLGRSAVRPRK
jgi:hypothetical protein